MDTTGPLPEPETAPSAPGARPRRRALRLGLAGFMLLVPVGVVALGVAAPVSQSNAVGIRAVGGDTTSSTAGSVRTLAGPTTTRPGDGGPDAASVIRAMRSGRPATTTSTTTTTTSTTTTTTTAPPVTTTTAAPVTTTTAPPAPAPAPPAAPSGANRQSGQATWYRWKAGNCAHNTLPKGTVVTVTNTATGASATCTVGDRGAFGYPTIIDLDATVFSQIAPLGAGRISVTISW